MGQVNLSEFNNKKCALVLSGGVVKAAAWHLGVALALEELGFSFKNNHTATKLPANLEISTFVGSSAGSLISIYLAQGLGPRDIINATLGQKDSAFKGISYREMFCLKKSKLRPIKGEVYGPLDEFPAFIKYTIGPLLNFPGFFTTLGVKDYLLKNILESDNFEDYVADLFIVSTQLDHSRKVIFSKFNYPNPPHDQTAFYYTKTSISDAAAASMAVPPFYCPYPIYNTFTNQVDYYIDGEIRETLSTHIAEDNNCDFIISSWTHTPYHFHDEVGSLANYGLAHIAIQSIYLMIQKKIVARRAQRATALEVIDSVLEYMRKEKFSSKHTKDIVTLLEHKLAVNTKAKLLDIYPDHSDYKLFFANSFSLNPEVSSHAVKMGYKKTMQVFNENFS